MLMKSGHKRIIGVWFSQKFSLCVKYARLWKNMTLKDITGRALFIGRGTVRLCLTSQGEVVRDSFIIKGYIVLLLHLFCLTGDSEVSLG